MKSNFTSIIIAILIIAAGGYWYFFGQSGNDAPLTTSMGVDATQTQFQVLVSQLKSISFDSSIFSDPKFTALVDLSTAVSYEPSGRSDPFASFSSVSR